ncbi:hypothetical protein MLD38_013208 [Melastoma candidum]|uniref:Uncharacterized protein n=1 Tax=Melastoma candidum TaxID=119954 RepID=A0ACB9R8T6_9MYRT|nr:hypothetical protein MLD38_013208 [Melastoma candidum]
MESGGFLFDPSCFRGGNLMFLGNGDGDSLVRGTNASMIQQPAKRRAFFGSSDMLFDEDYYDDQQPDKKRRLTLEQVQLLEKSFEMENKLEPERKSQLAKKLGLQPRQVAVWFQNRRARWKTKQLERDYDLLKSSYDTLLSNFDSIKKQNQKLILELDSLNKELESKGMATGATAGIKPDTPPPPELPQFNVKVEDRLSSGSGGSVVVDLLDSGNSCFPGDEYNHCMAAEQWEEDYRNNHSSGSYFPEALAAGEAEIQEEVLGLGWWPWP